MNEQQMSEPRHLVAVIDGQPVTTTTAIAEGVGRPHHGVIQLARQYQNDLERFGGVAFETRPFMTPGGQQKQEVAILNERQATLLLSYMRNTNVIRAFKIALVESFFAMAEELRSQKKDAEPDRRRRRFQRRPQPAGGCRYLIRQGLCQLGDLLLLRQRLTVAGRPGFAHAALGPRQP
jgi:phage regulator Rha-like protein